MKKISLIALALMAAYSMSAQENVVKEAEKAMKAGKTFVEVVEIVTPATTDPTTSTQAITFYIPGKTAFKEYDDFLGKRQLGMLKADDPKSQQIFHTMAKDLVGGYNYFIKALELDPVVDEKGKTKTKYTKEIINTLAGHHEDYNTAALDFWNAKDFDGAYNAWDIYLTMLDMPALEGKFKQQPDSILAEIMYNQGIAAWQADNFPNAIKAFRNAINKGFSKEQGFLYGTVVAESGKDTEALEFFALEGANKFPENNQFINQLINSYLTSKQYDKAMVAIDKAIAAHPTNAQYVALKGIIFDHQENPTAAMEQYKKALTIDSNNPIANFYYGVGLAAHADVIQDEFSGENFEAYKANTLNPMRREAVDYLEKAYNLDENLRTEILRVLNLVFYQLDDEQGMQSVKERQELD